MKSKFFCMLGKVLFHIEFIFLQIYANVCFCFYNSHGGWDHLYFYFLDSEGCWKFFMVLTICFIFDNYLFISLLLIETYKINKKFIFYRLYYSIYSLIFSSNINIDICFCLFNVCAIYFLIFYISVWCTSTSTTLCIDFILINFQINKKMEKRI